MLIIVILFVIVVVLIIVLIGVKSRWSAGTLLRWEPWGKFNGVGEEILSFKGRLGNRVRPLWILSLSKIRNILWLLCCKLSVGWCKEQQGKGVLSCVAMSSTRICFSPVSTFSWWCACGLKKKTQWRPGSWLQKAFSISVAWSQVWTRDSQTTTRLVSLHSFPFLCSIYYN